MQELWTNDLMKRFSGFAREAEAEVLILSPFIKVEALSLILSELSQKNVSVITRWRTADIISGVCDLEIYELLASRHIPLMVHCQLHMKGIVRDRNELLLSTANITTAGLSDTSTSNIECATVVRLQQKGKHWIEQIRNESTLVSRAEFERFRAHIENEPYKSHGIIEEFHFSKAPICRGFSIHDVPSVLTPKRLLESLYASKAHCRSDDWEKSLHDATTYGMPIQAGTMRNASHLLSNNFFAKPIIRALVEFIEAKRYFGEIKSWIRHKCPDADSLTNEELVRRVQSLFNWVVELSDGCFIVQRPHYSECLIRLSDDKLKNLMRNRTNSSCGYAS